MNGKLRAIKSNGSTWLLLEDVISRLKESEADYRANAEKFSKRDDLRWRLLIQSADTCEAEWKDLEKTISSSPEASFPAREWVPDESA